MGNHRLLPVPKVEWYDVCEKVRKERIIAVQRRGHKGLGVCAALITAAALLLVVGVALAQGMQDSGVYMLPSGRAVNDDVFACGNVVVNEGWVARDFYVAGNEIAQRGEVGGDVLAVGRTLTVEGNVGGNVRAAAQSLTLTAPVARNVLAFAQSINVGKTGVVRGNANLFAQNVVVNGEVKGNVRARAESVVIGGKVERDVWADTERLVILSTAEISGNLTYTSPREAEIEPGARIGGRVDFQPRVVEEKAAPTPAARVLRVFLSLLALLVAGLVLVYLLPRPASLVEQNLTRRPWASLGVGLGVLVGAPVATVILLISRIGVPLGLILIGLYAVLLGILLYAGKIFAGLVVGRWLLRRFRPGLESRWWVSLVLGLVLLFLAGLVPILGPLVGAAAFLFAWGAALLALYRLVQPA